jgi:hypothetical protein
MTPWQRDTISIEPTIATVHARAWLADLSRWDPGSKVAAVAVWLIEAPWAHPIWHSYRLTLVHLRSEPGFPEPLIHVPGATHEMVLAALSPDSPREPVVNGVRGATHEMVLATMGGIAAHHLLNLPVILTPVNFAAQMVCPGDAEAAGLVAKAVAMICERRLNPDTDFIAQWVALFGDGMMRDKRAAH